MRLEELMVGDLVYSSFSDIPCKVQYLELRESGYGSVKTSNVDGIKDIASLYPIPLTPEIIEKNGFKYNPFGTGFYECKTEEGNITCTKILDCWLFYINDNMIPNHFHYLHELQHALKLCGIEKTIEL